MNSFFLCDPLIYSLLPTSFLDYARRVLYREHLLSLSPLSNSNYYLNENCYITIYTEIFLIISILVLVTFLVNLDFYFDFKQILGIIVSKVAIFIYLLSFLLLMNAVSANFIIFNFLFILDNFIILVKSVLLIVIIICTLISLNYLKLENLFEYEYTLLVLLAISGILIIISSNDLITLYLAIELQSLSFYVLAAFKMFSNFSTEASLKYFILGAFSSGILLFGCSLIYGFTGLTNFFDLNLLFLNLNELNSSVF
jgi:NADH-quinone oxidoreductase subunit N